jgi:hypothetical protein
MLTLGSPIAQAKTAAAQVQGWKLEWHKNIPILNYLLYAHELSLHYSPFKIILISVGASGIRSIDHATKVLARLDCEISYY